MRNKQRGDIALPAIIGVVLLLSISGMVYKFYSSAERAGRLACEHEMEVADKMLEHAADEAKAEAANHITDMEAAYEAGKEEAAGQQRIYVTKGASDVAKYPVFNNPVCVLPDDSLHNINAARSGVRAAADPAPKASVEVVRAVPPAIRWPFRNDVPANDSGRQPAQ